MTHPASPETARLHDQILTLEAEVARLRDLLRSENQRANAAIDREETAEQAALEAQEERDRLLAAAALVSSPPADHTPLRDRIALAIEDAPYQPGTRRSLQLADAVLAVLPPADHSTCICGHGEAQHFEDACLVCDCGDYLTPDAARETIARYQAAVLPSADPCSCRDKPAFTAAIGYPVRCPHCPPGTTAIPPTHWTKHVQRHHPEVRLAVLPSTDRAAVSAALWAAAEHHTVAEWICCDPIDPAHALCVQGGAALRMLKALLVDDPDAWKPAPLLDEVMRLVPPAGSAAEAHRLALSQALDLGTGAPWEAIHDRVKELRRMADEQPAEHDCKPGAKVYFCPTSGETESDCHGGFNACCDRPDLHQPAAAAWPETDGAGEPAELRALPREVRRLVHAVDRMRSDWAEAPEGGPERRELWTEVHEACEAVWNRPAVAGQAGAQQREADRG